MRPIITVLESKLENDDPVERWGRTAGHWFSAISPRSVADTAVVCMHERNLAPHAQNGGIVAICGEVKTVVTQTLKEEGA